MKKKAKFKLWKLRTASSCARFPQKQAALDATNDHSSILGMHCVIHQPQVLGLKYMHRTQCPKAGVGSTALLQSFPTVSVLMWLREYVVTVFREVLATDAPVGTDGKRYWVFGEWPCLSSSHLALTLPLYSSNKEKKVTFKVFNIFSGWIYHHDIPASQLNVFISHFLCLLKVFFCLSFFPVWRWTLVHL